MDECRRKFQLWKQNGNQPLQDITAICGFVQMDFKVDIQIRGQLVANSLHTIGGWTLMNGFYESTSP